MKFTTSTLLPIALAGFCAALPSYNRRTTIPNPQNTTNITIVLTNEPLESTTTPNQTQVLQYALTLEHLENAFYTKYLAEFTPEQFANESYPDYVYGGLKQISEHEATHVEFLTAALGADAVAPCNYSFPVTDIASFVAFSMAVESVGASAYLGAAHFISDPEVATAAASILSTEARHSGFVSSDIVGEAPWSSSFETPLDMNQVFTIASQFIVSCPSTNAPLPVKAFPALNVSYGAQPGAQATFQFNANVNEEAFVAIFNGLNTTFVPITTSNSSGKATTGTAVIPDFFQGLVYALITSSNSSVNDTNTIAGPAMLNFPFTANVSNFRV